MTQRILSLNKAYLLALVAVFLAFPSVSSASIEITEIMYDAPGSDSGREWVEITNTGGEIVDLAPYRFFESNTNHKLVAVSGSSALFPGSSLVIVGDTAKFSADFPEYSGAILKSTFALSNTGETLSIKNASSTILTSATYTSSQGASGDGGSLHKEGDSFVSALPNPGTYPGELRAVEKAEVPVQTKTTSTKSKTTSSVAKKSPPLEYQTASVNDSSASAGVKVPSNFPGLEWIVGLGVLALLGAVAVFFTQSKISPITLKETTNSGEEFDIVDI